MKKMTQQLIEAFETLPDSLQQEALRYIEYLQTKMVSYQAEVAELEYEYPGN